MANSPVTTRRKINNERLKMARILAGLSRQEVADALGFKQRHTISHYEAGRRTPRPDILLALCELYKVPHPRVFYSD